MNLTRKWEKLLKIIERVIFILVLNVQSLRQIRSLLAKCIGTLYVTVCLFYIELIMSYD